MRRREFITLLGGVSPLRNSRLAVILFAASLIIPWGNAAMAMTLKSPAFQQNGHIPSKYTCEGEDVSPPLAWEDVSTGAKSLVLIIDDPDAPDPKAPKMVWVHWVVYNIPPDTKSFSATSYDADVARARRLMPLIEEGFAASLPEAATRFALSHPAMGVILVGMATPQQFEDALAAVHKGPLPPAALDRLSALQQAFVGEPR